MNRIEHVLAVAVLCKLQATREARAASFSVSTAELRTAALCDALARALGGGRNNVPVGVPAKLHAGSTNAMAEAVLGERGENGQPRYASGIAKVNDTADVAALIRNGISAQQPDNGVVVVAGPLSNLAAAMMLPDLMELVPKRVRVLVVAATPEDVRADLAAARKVLGEWPTRVVWMDAPLSYPAAEWESRFSALPHHPVLDAYRAYRKPPYDVTLQPAAAVFYAVHPDSGLFAASAPGTAQLLDDGSMEFRAMASGRHLTVHVADGQQAAAGEQLAALASAPPPQPTQGRGGPRP